MTAPVLQLLRAAEWLRRGHRRLTVNVCSLCGQKNRVDHFRLIFGGATKAKCGRCGQTLAWRTRA